MCLLVFPLRLLVLLLLLLLLSSSPHLSPPHYRRPPSVKLLISHGCSIHQLDSAGFSPLHSAVLLGHTAVVRLLLSHGASPNTRSALHQTPLHAAADGNRLGEREGEKVRSDGRWDKGRIRLTDV